MVLYVILKQVLIHVPLQNIDTPKGIRVRNTSVSEKLINAFGKFFFVINISISILIIVCINAV